MYRTIIGFTIILFPSLTAATKCAFRKVSKSNETDTDDWFFCPTDCCGHVCCPPKEYHNDTTVTEYLASIFGVLFIVGSLGFLLSWTTCNFRKVVRSLRNRACPPEIVSLTSVENVPRGFPKYDIPMSPSLFPPLQSSVDKADTDKVAFGPLEKPRHALPRGPPSYSSVVKEMKQEAIKDSLGDDTSTAPKSNNSYIKQKDDIRKLL